MSNQNQSDVINGIKSDVLHLRTDVLQGSVLGRLHFLIYINDLHDGLTGELFMFDDDSSVFHIVNKYISLCAAKMNKDLDCINNWSVQWLVSINTTKTFSCFLQPKDPDLFPHQKITDEQNGFRHDRSCADHLSTLTHNN